MHAPCFPPRDSGCAVSGAMTTSTAAARTTWVLFILVLITASPVRCTLMRGATLKRVSSTAAATSPPPPPSAFTSAASSSSSLPAPAPPSPLGWCGADLSSPSVVETACDRHRDACAEAQQALRRLRDSASSHDSTSSPVVDAGILQAFLGRMCSRATAQPPTPTQLSHRRSRREDPANTTATAAPNSTATATAPESDINVTERPVSCTFFAKEFSCTSPREAKELEVSFVLNHPPRRFHSPRRPGQDVQDVIDSVRPASLIFTGSVYLMDIQWLLQADFPTVHNITVRGLFGVNFPLSIVDPLPAVTTIDVALNGLTQLSISSPSVSTGFAQSNSANTSNSNSRSNGGFARGSQIEVLNLKRNGLNAIDVTVLQHMPNLLTLVWSGNQIRSLQPELFTKVPLLRCLVIANNRLSSLSSGTFTGLAQLQELDISNNGISVLQPRTFASVIRLRELNLDGNPIETADPLLFSYLPDLRSLRLTSTALTQLPSTLFRNNTQLRELWLFHNQFTSVPAEMFGPLTRLRFLTMTGNLLSELPANLFRTLTHLRELYISSNAITKVDKDAFSGLPSLRTLVLVNNNINALRLGTFAASRRLRYVDLSGNSIRTIDPDLFGECPYLAYLIVSNNQLTSFHHRSLPVLQELRMQSNPLREQPDLRGFTNLTSLRMSGHRIPELEFAHFFALPKLETLHVAADHEFGRSVAKRPSLDGIDKVPQFGAQLRALDVRHVILPQVLDVAVSSQQLNLRSLAAGWPGMSESLIPIHLLCQALNRDVEDFTLTNTAYTSINLCPNTTFHSVFLTHNKYLHTLKVHNALEQLNLYRSTALTSLVLPRAEILDLSHTRVMSLTPLCVEWGARLLFYRGVNNPLLRTRGSRLFERCLRRLEVVDFSDSDWLDQIAEVKMLLQRPVVLSTESFLAEDLTSLHNRPDAPALTLHRTPITCHVAFSNEGVRPQEDQATVQTQLTYQFRCSCARGFTPRGDVCLPDPTAIIIIVISSTLGFVVLIAGVYIQRLYRKRRRDKRRLQDQAKNLRALEAAWEIDFKDLRLLRKIGHGSYGSVQTADWDGLKVAVKVLHETMRMLDEHASEEFEKEAMFLRQARHPNVVKFFGAGRKEGDGCPFIVLEYVELGSLRDLIRPTSKLQHLLSRYRRACFSSSSGGTRGGATGQRHADGDDGYDTLVLVETGADSAQGLSSYDKSSIGGFESSSTTATATFAASAGVASTTSASGFSDTPLNEPLLPRSRASTSNHDAAAAERHKREQENATRIRVHTVRDRRMRTDSMPPSLWALKKQLARDIACGMAFIHSLGHSHRDLKTANVLVSRNLRAKIADFGTLRKVAGSANDNSSKGDGREGGGESIVFSVGVSEWETTCVGTPLYMAPEVMANKKPGSKADVFSFGVLLWELVVEKEPDLVAQEVGTVHRGEFLNTLLKLLMEGKRLRFPKALKDVPPALTTVMHRCMALEPRDRPAFEELIEELSSDGVGGGGGEPAV